MVQQQLSREARESRRKRAVARACVVMASIFSTRNSGDKNTNKRVGHSREREEGVQYVQKHMICTAAAVSGVQLFSFLCPKAARNRGARKQGRRQQRQRCIDARQQYVLACLGCKQQHAHPLCSSVTSKKIAICARSSSCACSASHACTRIKMSRIRPKHNTHTHTCSSEAASSCCCSSSVQNAVLKICTHDRFSLTALKLSDRNGC